MNKIKFSEIIPIYRTATRSHDNIFNITVSDDNINLLKKIFEDAAVTTGITILGIYNPNSITLGQNIELSIDAPSPQIGYLFLSTDDFFKKFGSQEPNNYYIFEENFHSQDSPPPKNISLYRRTLPLIGIFKEAASHYDKQLDELIFFDDKKISMRIQYKFSDLRSMNQGTKASILDFFNKEDVCNKDQKIDMLREAIISVLKGLRHADFPLILNNLDSILSEFQNSYNLFTSQFSYKKIKNEIEQFKLDETIKINKTLTDIQNQALGIPIATLIAATQMKAVEVLNTQYYINLLLCAGCVVFCILCMITISNQCSTLSTINKEIKRQKNKIKTEYQAITNSGITTIYNELLKKVCCQRLKLALITLAVIFIALSSILFYYYVTVPSPIIDYILSFFITIPT